MLRETVLSRCGGSSHPYMFGNWQTDEDGKVTIPINGGKAGSRTRVLVPWQGEAPTPPTSLDTNLSEYAALPTTPTDAAEKDPFGRGF